MVMSHFDAVNERASVAAHCRRATLIFALSIVAVVIIVLLVIVLPFASGRADSAVSPSPPSQPATGPGGVEAVFTKVVVTVHDDEAPGYWLFEPKAARDGATSPDILPLVLFLSGCCPPPGTLNPEPAKYRDWIDHIAKRGAVVIYPRFRFYSGLQDVMKMVRAAVAEISAGPHPAVDTTHIAITGHSIGGLLAVNYAGAASEDVPTATALMLAMPACVGCPNPIDDLTAISPTTDVLVVVADEDQVGGDVMARQIWAKLDQIPLDRRDYITILSDSHGQPPLIADHELPATAPFAGASGVLDALDWYGLWRPFDALVACSRAGQECATALGDTPEQRFMGQWSDGVSVIELKVTDTPETQ